MLTAKNNKAARSRSTILRTSLLIASALCACISAASSFATDRTAVVPQLDWAPCGFGTPGLQCATAKVPLDYDQPNGRTTEIALAKVPASDPDHRIGTLFLNPGGPGASGVDLAAFGFGAFLDQTLLGRFDVVGWDPRGIGGSTPIQCWDSNEDREAYLQRAPVFPYERQQERPFYDLLRSIATLCFSRNQPILRHMSTADVVRDLDLLRRAVGDDKLNYLGYSYGSHIGNTYANMFPSKVRALVIDGVLNPILWTSGWQISADRDASFEVLGEFFRLCDAAQCPLSAQGGAQARFEALRQFARTAPIVLPDGAGGAFVYSYDFFVADSVGAMYSPEIWPAYGDFLGALGDAILGDAGAGARALRLRRGIEDALRSAAPKRAPYDNGAEAFLGTQCSDAEYPFSLAAYSAIGRYAEAGSFQGPYWWWINAGCAAWPTSADRYAGPWVTRTSSPVLVVGNFFDPATDYDGAVASSRLLRNSRLLSYAGWGHVASYTGRSQCIDDYVTLYLLDGSLPPRGTVCEAESSPFAAATLRSKQARSMPRVGLPTLEPLPQR